jgi:hypothetical protein
MQRAVSRVTILSFIILAVIPSTTNNDIIEQSEQQEKNLPS